MESDMREDGREKLSFESERTKGMKYYKRSLWDDVVACVAVTLVVILFAGLTVFTFKYTKLCGWVMLACTVFMAVRFFKEAISNLVTDGGLYLAFKNGEFEMVRANVSLTTSRVETERRGRYRVAVCNYYKFFKDYGECSCSSSVKEGDEYVLVVKKTGKDRIIWTYQASEYIFNG